MSLRTRDVQEARRQVYRLSHLAVTWLDRIRAMNYEEGVALGEQLLTMFARAAKPEVRSNVLQKNTLRASPQGAAPATLAPVPASGHLTEASVGFWGRNRQVLKPTG